MVFMGEVVKGNFNLFLSIKPTSTILSRRKKVFGLIVGLVGLSIDVRLSCSSNGNRAMKQIVQFLN